MSGTNDDRLEKLLARAHTAKAQKQDEDDRAKQEKQADFDLMHEVSKKWWDDVPTIAAIVGRISSRLETVGVRLKFRTEESTGNPCVAIGYINAFVQDDQQKRMIVLNVHRTGEVRAFIETPQKTTVVPTKFDVLKADAARYESIIMDFVEDVI